MISDPLVTIAIAAHNNASYVERCIASVLEQTYSNIEVLLIDDGSSDNSVSVYHKYDFDERVRIIVKKNEGLSSSRQMALDNANGKYICFIDADDYVSNQYIQSMYEHLRKVCSDICVCGSYFVDESGSIITDTTEAYSTSEEFDAFQVTNEELKLSYYTLLCRYFMCDSWNKMYRTDFIRDSGVNFKFPLGLNGSDLAFNHKLLLHNPKMSTITNKEYYHVIYRKSAVHRENKQLEKSVVVYIAQIIDECQKLAIADQLEEQISYLYMASMRDVFQDTCNEIATNKKELAREFTRLKLVCFNYIKVKKMKVQWIYPTQSLSLFSLTLHMPGVISLMAYFYARKSHLHI